MEAKLGSNRANVSVTLALVLITAGCGSDSGGGTAGRGAGTGTGTFPSTAGTGASTIPPGTTAGTGVGTPPVTTPPATGIPGGAGRGPVTTPGVAGGGAGLAGRGPALGGAPATTMAGTGASSTAGTSGSSLGGTTAGSGSALAGSGASGTGASASGGRSGGGTAAGSGGGATSGGGTGMCCDGGDCLCHGEPPAMLSARNGPFKTATKRGRTGTIVYPTDAEPPLAGIAICPGFLNTGPEMMGWGTFYASWGIVTVVTNTGAADIPDIRAGLLLGAVDEMKKENMDSSSPLSGKMSGRYGTSGYSMGGGGTTIAASMTPELKTSVGLAAWGGRGNGTKVATLLLCGDIDAVAPCNMSDSVYTQIPAGTPKMQIHFPGADHLAAWFGPGDAAGGQSGGFALAWQKVYLEGDTRWKTLLMGKAPGSSRNADLK